MPNKFSSSGRKWYIFTTQKNTHTQKYYHFRNFGSAVNGKCDSLIRTGVSLRDRNSKIRDAKLKQASKCPSEKPTTFLFRIKEAYLHSLAIKVGVSMSRSRINPDRPSFVVSRKFSHVKRLDKSPFGWKKISAFVVSWRTILSFG